MADFVVREYDNHIAVMHSGCNQPSIFCEASFFGPTRQSDAEAYAKTLNERAATESSVQTLLYRDRNILASIAGGNDDMSVVARVVLDLYRKANP